MGNEFFPRKSVTNPVPPLCSLAKGQNSIDVEDRIKMPVPGFHLKHFRILMERMSEGREKER